MYNIWRKIIFQQVTVPILIHTGIAISDVLDLAEPSFCEKHLKNSQPNVIHL